MVPKHIFSAMSSDRMKTIHWNSFDRNLGMTLNRISRIKDHLPDSIHNNIDQCSFPFILIKFSIRSDEYSRKNFLFSRSFSTSTLFERESKRDTLHTSLTHFISTCPFHSFFFSFLPCIATINQSISNDAIPMKQRAFSVETIFCV